MKPLHLIPAEDACETRLLETPNILGQAMLALHRAFTQEEARCEPSRRDKINQHHRRELLRTCHTYMMDLLQHRYLLHQQFGAMPVNDNSKSPDTITITTDTLMLDSLLGLLDRMRAYAPDIPVSQQLNNPQERLKILAIMDRLVIALERSQALAQEHAEQARMEKLQAELEAHNKAEKIKEIKEAMTELGPVPPRHYRFARKEITAPAIAHILENEICAIPRVFEALQSTVDMLGKETDSDETSLLLRHRLTIAQHQIHYDLERLINARYAQMRGFATPHLTESCLNAMYRSVDAIRPYITSEKHPMPSEISVSSPAQRKLLTNIIDRHLAARLHTERSVFYPNTEKTQEKRADFAARYATPATSTVNAR